MSQRLVGGEKGKYDMKFDEVNRKYTLNLANYKFW